jgi:cytochrome c2
VDGLIEDYAHYPRGEAASIGPDVSAVTGRPAGSFETFLADYKTAFTAAAGTGE